MRNSLFIAIIVVAMFNPRAMGQQKRCECTFKDTTYEAFGTDAACTAQSRRNDTSCKISFGGLGADPKMLQQVLGLRPEEIPSYNANVFTVLITYLQALKDKNLLVLADPAFIEQAFPIFMRGAYLQSNSEIDAARRLDSDVMMFTKEHAKDLGQFYSGKGPEFVTSAGGTKFSVTKESI